MDMHRFTTLTVTVAALLLHEHILLFQYKFFTHTQNFLLRFEFELEKSASGEFLLATPVTL